MTAVSAVMIGLTLLAYGEREQHHRRHQSNRGRDAPEQPPATRSQDRLVVELGSVTQRQRGATTGVRSG